MITLLDGPLGTELVARGVTLESESWSADAIDAASEVICDIHRDYVQAGATVHTANTFRTRRRNCGSQWQRLTQKAITLTREQLPNHQNSPDLYRLAGSLGPLADCYRPERFPQANAAFEHREMAEWLAECECDLIFCETFANPLEAETAVRAAQSTGLETWIGLTAGPDNSLMSSKEMAEAAVRCVDAGASAVIITCTDAQSSLNHLIEIERQKLGIQLGVSANAGPIANRLGWIDQKKIDQREAAAERYADIAETWCKSGATIIGACCGCSPIHLAKLSERLRQS